MLSLPSIITFIIRLLIWFLLLKHLWRLGLLWCFDLSDDDLFGAVDADLGLLIDNWVVDYKVPLNLTIADNFFDSLGYFFCMFNLPERDHPHSMVLLNVVVILVFLDLIFDDIYVLLIDGSLRPKFSFEGWLVPLDFSILHFEEVLTQFHFGKRGPLLLSDGERIPII